MFVIAELKDTIRVPPWSFKSKLQDTIRDEINRKLANKVGFDLPDGSVSKYPFTLCRSCTMWDCVSCSRT